MSQDKVNKYSSYNNMILEILSLYLNYNPYSIREDLIDELVKECNIEKNEAFSILLAEVCGLDIDNNCDHMEIYEKYFPYMIHKLDTEKYKNNPYYKNIKIPDIEVGKWKFKIEKYKPYEAFVFNDLKQIDDGRIIPQIGFFDVEFEYPAVLEDNCEWMLITPNEIETMEEAVDEAHGKVLTFGLGLGYYAYMTSLKQEVTSVTIVERDKSVIDLFKKFILPQFKNAEKIKVICDDAYTYAENKMSREGYDFVFSDIWHDPSDGIGKYLYLKQFEKDNKKCTFRYWIEKTMKCYIE